MDDKFVTTENGTLGLNDDLRADFARFLAETIKENEPA